MLFSAPPSAPRLQAAGCLVAMLLLSIDLWAQEVEAPPAPPAPTAETSPRGKALLPASPEASPVSPPAQAAPPAPSEALFGTPGDVADTRERLDRIYERLGRRSSAEDEDSWLSCRGSGPGEIPVKSQPLSLPPALGYILVGIIFAAVLIPLLLSLRRHLPSTPPRRPADPEEPEATPAVQDPWRVDLSECRGLAEQGRLAEAFAALHRLTLLQLERSLALRLDRNTTNWEYVRRLASRPETSELLAEVTRAAEQSVLGNRPPAAELYWQLHGRVEQIGGAR